MKSHLASINTTGQLEHSPHTLRNIMIIESLNAEKANSVNRQASPQRSSLINSAKKLIQDTFLSPERKSKIFQIPEQQEESPAIPLECLVTEQTEPNCET
jgi:hypothetical protein